MYLSQSAVQNEMDGRIEGPNGSWSFETSGCINCSIGHKGLLMKRDTAIDTAERESAAEIFDLVEITNAGFQLEPGRLLLVYTAAKFQVPKGLHCIFEGRTRFARMGLQVHQTAPHVWSGHGDSKPRHIVGEFVWHGGAGLRIYPNDENRPGDEFRHLISLSFARAEASDEAYDQNGTAASEDLSANPWGMAPSSMIRPGFE